MAFRPWDIIVHMDYQTNSLFGNAYEQLCVRAGERVVGYCGSVYDEDVRSFMMVGYDRKH